MLSVGSWSQDQQQPCNQINDSRTICQGASQTLSRVPFGVLFLSSGQWGASLGLTPGSQPGEISSFLYPKSKPSGADFATQSVANRVLGKRHVPSGGSLKVGTGPKSWYASDPSLKSGRLRSDVAYTVLCGNPLRPFALRKLKY